MKCHAKAEEAGTNVDRIYLQKVRAKLDGGAAGEGVLREGGSEVTEPDLRVAPNPPATQTPPGYVPTGPEVCENVDNDGNGMTDEDLGTTRCGTGQCENTVPNCGMRRRARRLQRRLH